MPTDPCEVYFTSAATESNNLRIEGLVGARTDRAIHIVTVATEHCAVLDPCRRVEREGGAVTYALPGPDGLVEGADVEWAITDATVLVSVMSANNEIGVI